MKGRGEVGRPSPVSAIYLANDLFVRFFTWTAYRVTNLRFFYALSMIVCSRITCHKCIYIHHGPSHWNANCVIAAPSSGELPIFSRFDSGGFMCRLPECGRSAASSISATFDLSLKILPDGSTNSIAASEVTTSEPYVEVSGGVLRERASQDDLDGGVAAKAKRTFSWKTT